MKYEPCNGACYVGSNVVDLSELQNNIPRFHNIINKMIKIHDPACGNENIRYGIDLDEDNQLFVASFMHNNKLELLSGVNLVPLLEKFCDMAIAYWNSDIGKEELRDYKGLGHDVCTHGKNDDLIKFIHNWSNIKLAA